MIRKRPLSFDRSRRRFLGGAALAASALAAPTLWIPRRAYAAQTAARGQVRHILYMRLSGGFRFTTLFNANVAAEWNPFGAASNVPGGTEWTPGALMDGATWLTGDAGTALADLGMVRATQLADAIAVLPCVDHEPLAGRADGNHGSGLERFLTGFVGGPTSFLTMANYGLRDAVAAAIARGETPLPAVSFGDADMARGFGIHAAFRPPVVQGDGFERFGFDPSRALPAWAQNLPGGFDARLRDRLHPGLRDRVDSYVRSREATGRYAVIFNDPVLKVAQGTNDVVDGISNAQLGQIFGNDGTGRACALALRLFKFGSPVAFVNQGGYDLHSDEERNLPVQIDSLNRILSGLALSLQRMIHPAGGTYWDHTLVVLGSEFGRTAGGNRFNSARGSDHGGDNATRWMSMPMMGGLIQRAGIGGRTFGSARSSDLRAEGPVYAYRSVLKTLLDLLGADHAEFFPGDEPILDLFG